MAEQIIPEGFAKCTITFGGDAVNFPAAITFGVSNEGDATPLTIAGVVLAAYDDHILPDLSEDLTCVKILTKNGPNDVGPFAEVDDGNAGGASSVCVPPQVSLLVKKLTAAGGRKNRGRLYQPGIPRSATNDRGEVLTANLATFVTDWGSFLSSIETAGHPMVLLHESSLTPTPVTSLSPEVTLATQRRRQRRS